jgi:rare lipoprotein A
MRVLRRPIHAGFVLVALAAMFTSGCGHHAARVNAPLPPARIGSTETGVASWYGIPYDGRRAASGEIYDMRQLTAAHRRLPFQTWVEVTNLSNGKQVDVRINDRGPFVKGRILDLSQAAARDIDMLRAGTVRVRLKVIRPPSTSPREPLREPVEITAAPAAAPTTPATETPIADAEAPVTVSPTTVGPVTTTSDAAPSDTAPAVTTSPVAKAPVTTAPMTTAPVTTAPIRSAPMTTAPITSAPVTTAPMTTAPVTTPPVPATQLSASRPVVASSALISRTPRYVVQAGAFSDPARAESLRAVLATLFVEARVAPSNGRTPPLWRVIVGREMTREQAAELAVRVRREAGTAIVVLEPTPNPPPDSAPNH